MTILFVRHGQSLANSDNTSLIDTPNHMSPLTDKGWDQAHATGEFLRDYFAQNPPANPIRLWVSPYVRATQTALGVLETCGDVPWDVSRRGRGIQFDDRLRERDSVYFEGYTPEENAQQFPLQIKYFKKVREQQGGRYYARPFGGENLSDISLRVHSFLSDLFHDIERGITDHVIVSHGNLLMSFILTITKAHPFFIDELAVAPNGGVHLFDLDPLTDRYEDYGLIFDSDKHIRHVEKPSAPVKRDVDELLSRFKRLS